MKYVTVNNALEILDVKLHSAFQLKPLKSSLLLLSSLLRGVVKYTKKYLQSDECIFGDHSYNYFESKMWKESGSSGNKLPSIVSPRTWHRHSELLSLWQEQRK